MNCYLPWNLKDMTNISAEKLQKNISRQTSYIELYRTELMKESLKFNIASLLRHVCMNRSAFGSDDLSRKATDCLIVFLHATSFLKVAYFTPTDVENPAVPKCCRNLHRLMLENVKATMRYIDYTVLLRYAMGDVSTNGMYSLREQLHSEVFPSDEMFDVCAKESINDDFYRIVDQEMDKAESFIDFDVQRNTGFDTAFCMMFSKMTRLEEELPESEYGVIGASAQALDKPFIRYGNSFYSFVTSYSLKNISNVLKDYIVDEPEPDEAPVADETPVEETVPVEGVVSAEPETEPEDAPMNEEPAEEMTEEPEDEPMDDAVEEIVLAQESEEPVIEETLQEPSAEEESDMETEVEEQDETVEVPTADENQESDAQEEPTQEEEPDMSFPPKDETVEDSPIEDVVDNEESYSDEPEFEEFEEVITADEIYDSDAEEEPAEAEDQEPEQVEQPSQNEDSIYKEHEIDEDEIEESDEEEPEPEQETPVQEMQESSYPEDEVEESANDIVETTEEKHSSLSENIKEFIESHDPHQIILPNQVRPSDRMDDLFDDDDFEEIITEEEENLDNDSAYIETDEYEYPDEFEEDDSNSQEELERLAGDVYELAEEDQLDDDDEPSEENEKESDAQEQKEYSALVSDDTYRYLDEADPSEFEKDEMLEEQEILEDVDEYEDEEPEAQPQEEEEDPYSGESLFSLADDDVEENAEPEPAPEEQPKAEPIVETETEPKQEPVAEPQPDMSFPPQDEPEPEEEPAVEEAPAEEQPIEEQETEPEPQPEPVTEAVEETVVEEVPAQEEEETEPEPVVEPAPEAETVAVPETEPEAAPEAEAQPEPVAEPQPEPVEEPAPEPQPQPEPVEEPKPAEPDVLPLLDHILKFSPSRNNPITIYLMGCQFQQQKDLVSFIERARKSWLIDGKDKMFAIPDTEISVAIFSETQDPMINIQRRENIGAVMYSQHKDSWNSLELSFDTSGQMVKASYNRVSRMSFSDWEWRIVEKLGNRILERKGK